MYSPGRGYDCRMVEVFSVRKAQFTDSAFEALSNSLDKFTARTQTSKYILIIADKFLKQDLEFTKWRGTLSKNKIIFFDLESEPTTSYIDEVCKGLIDTVGIPSVVVGIGGGSVLDSAKAISNLLGNGGTAADYQGWDLLTKPGIYKIGVPTLFGTGSETSRTCVLLNKEKKIKLGMNSHFSLFDEIIVDSGKSLSCPKKVWAMTALDGFFHATEIIHGRARVGISDHYSAMSLQLIKDGLSMGETSRETGAHKIALGSYFGGMALANGMVGLIHPFSAALSTVFGISHALANCMAMSALTDYYPESTEFFNSIVDKYEIKSEYFKKESLEDSELMGLIQSTVIHEKPLQNHLGVEWRNELTDAKMENIFRKIIIDSAGKLGE